MKASIEGIIIGVAPRLTTRLNMLSVSTRYYWWLVAALVATVGLALRIYRLDSAGLWFDEAFSYAAARLDPDAVLRVSAATGYPPLYYLFLHSWMVFFGSSEAALRFPSLLVGTILVVVVVAVGSDMLGRRSGLLAGLLTALVPMLVHFSQEARVYSLTALLALLATWCLWRCLRRTSWPFWLLYSVLLTSLLYSHYIAILLIAAHALVCAGWAWKQRRLRVLYPFTATLALSLLAFAPWVPYFMAGPHAVALRIDPSLMAYWSLLVSVVGNEVHVGGHGLRDLLAGGTALLLIGLLLWNVFRARPAPSIYLLLIVCALPLVVLLPVSGFEGLARHVSFVFPMFWLLVAWTIVAITSMRQRAFVLLLILAAFGINLYLLYQGKFDVNEHWREVGTALNSYDQDTLILVYPGYYVVTLDYYYQERADVQPLPRTLDLPSISFSPDAVGVKAVDLPSYNAELLSHNHVIILGAFVGYDYSLINTWLTQEGYHPTSDTPLMQKFYNRGIIGDFQR